MKDFLRPYCEELIPSGGVYAYYFDKLEILMVLSHLYHVVKPRSEVRGFIGHPDNSAQILDEIKRSVSTLNDASPYVESGIGGPEYEDWNEGIDTLQHSLDNYRRGKATTENRGRATSV